MRLFLALFLGISFGPSTKTECVVEVRTPAELAAAAHLLATPVGRETKPLTVRFAAGDYQLKESLRILRSRVKLIGEPGTRLWLAAGVDEPVIAVGSQREIPRKEERIEDISISDLMVDGNRHRQSLEVGRTNPWIRNNGIDVRMTKRLKIERVRVKGCRSGGLVISWNSMDVRVKDSIFEDNHFDGVAYYDSAHIETLYCVMRGNGGAGVSADNHFMRSRFVDCEIEGNRDVGIFLRASRGIDFLHCGIASNGSWGAFLAHNEAGDGVHGVRFLHCIFAGNQGGLRMASVNRSQSSGTKVCDCIFQGSKGCNRANIDSAGSKVSAWGNQEPYKE